MAGELQYIALPAQTGLTVIARIYLGGVQVGADLACTEQGASAEYVADMPAVALGEYTVRFFLSDETFLKSGAIDWDGAKEIVLRDISALLSSLLAYHDNDTVFYGLDNATEVKQSEAYHIALYDSSGAAGGVRLKTIQCRDTLGNPSLIANASRLVLI